MFPFLTDSNPRSVKLKQLTVNSGFQFNKSIDNFYLIKKTQYIKNTDRNFRKPLFVGYEYALIIEIHFLLR